jgi:hypothetical protein
VNVGTISELLVRRALQVCRVGRRVVPRRPEVGRRGRSSPTGKSLVHGTGPQWTHVVEELQGTEALVNTGQLWPDPDGAWMRVRPMQTKLHPWAVDGPDRRFDDLYALIHHPDLLTVAGERVRGNKGTAGVDRVPAFIADDADIVVFLGDVREQLKEGTFTPLLVRERMIPEPGSGGQLRLGIPTQWTGLCKPASCWSWHRSWRRTSRR